MLFEYNEGSEKTQHLSDRHSIIVTKSGVTTNGTNAHNLLAPFFVLITAFMWLPFHSKLCTGLDFQSKCPGNVVFVLFFSLLDFSCNILYTFCCGLLFLHDFVLSLLSVLDVLKT